MIDLGEWFEETRGIEAEEQDWNEPSKPENYQ